MHGAPLTNGLTLGDIMTTVSNGRSEMPAFGGVYEPGELHDVATFILEELVD